VLDAGKPIVLSVSLTGIDGKGVRWRKVEAADLGGQIDLGDIYSGESDRAAYGYAELVSAFEGKAQVAVGSDDTLTVWLNGEKVYDYSGQRGFAHEQDRFDVTLRRGTNRVLVLCGNRGGPWQFAVSVAAPAEHAFLKAPAGGAFDPESYRSVALEGKGSAARGRALFVDQKGLACARCHAIGKQGANVGPELSSVGAKYPRDELISAVLYPSAKVSSGYEPTTFALAGGRVVTGIIRTETADSVEIMDADAKLVRIAKSDIDARKRSEVSLMPNGLASGLSAADFADLIAFLETLRDVK
jgi:putative heme-binding domain-containing protein